MSRGRTPAESLALAIREVGAQPADDAKQADKKRFSERLSRALAQFFADALRPDFRGIKPDAAGQGHESRAKGEQTRAKIDVNYSTPELGLGLGVSVKTINAKDSGRFTKNFTRADKEFRAEAAEIHIRQPYAVLVGVFFLPYEAALDGSDEKRQPSSFASAVQQFRTRNGRSTPQDRADTFELFFVGLYHLSGPRHGQVAFIDVREDPPLRGPPLPPTLLGVEEVLGLIKSTYDDRNDPPFNFTESTLDRAN